MSPWRVRLRRALLGAACAGSLGAGIWAGSRGPAPLPPALPWYADFWPASAGPETLAPWRRFPGESGERLVYSVRWGVFTVGEATSEIHPAEPFVPCWETVGRAEPEYGTVTLEDTPAAHPALSWPRQAFRVRAEARSRAWVPYRVRNEIDSWIDAEGTFPWRFDKVAREGGGTSEEHVEIDHRDGTAYYYKKREEEASPRLRRIVHNVEPLAQDPFSILYYLRLIPLPPGSVHNLRVHTGYRSWDTVVHVARTETLKTPAGTFRCLVLKPVFDYEGIFTRESDPTVWVEERTHIPIRMEVKVTIGHIQTILQEAHGVPAWEGGR